MLFLCTGNSCRSQMAEGFARVLKGLEDFEVYSAGLEKQELNPLAVRVMGELGIDITNQRSKTIEELPVKEFDYVMTMCDNARESCPRFPGATRLLHHSFPDPPYLTRNMKNEKEKLTVYRRVRDEIREFMEHSLPVDLSTGSLKKR